jgi:probable HAF family extracellular repeat protein
MNAVGKTVGVGLGLLGFLLATTSAEAQQYQYSFFNYPGAPQTNIRGISNNGALVGAYFFTASTSGGEAPYEYANGVFSAGPYGVFRGVNDSGVAVGNSSGQGFEYSGGVYTPVNVPGAVQTRAIGINDSGDIVGSYVTPSGSVFGYADIGGVFTTISPPSAITAPGAGGSTLVTGINNDGEIVGYYENQSDQGLGFTYVNGVYSDIQVDVPGATYSGVLGVNDAGTVVGFYGTTSGSELPFLEANGVYTLLDIPGQANDTFVNATGINNSGTIVGDFDRPNGELEGFIAVPIKTLADLQGGAPGDPTPLPIGGPIGDITGSIGGQGSTDFYKLSWSGGSFAATLSLTGANANSAYLFEILDAQGNVIETLTLDQLDGFSGTFSEVLAAGDYEIGLEADSPDDPAFDLQFATPVYGVPEPTTWTMLLVGLGGIGGSLRSRGSRGIMGPQRNRAGRT